MKIITRETGYAIKSLCFMVKTPEKKITTGSLAEFFNISRPFLRKILQRLHNAGILQSFKGKGGGFKLAIRPSDLFLIDLIEIFQGPVQLSGCYTKGQKCPLLQNCPIRHEIERMEKNFIKELTEISLEMLLEKQDVVRKHQEK
mgnify:CR=1 FL=1